MEILEKITLTAPDGARAEVYLHGAHLTSWIPAGGGERLFLSAASEFRPGAAIRGGVPVLFPQFAGRGSLPKHGFARNFVWNFEGVDSQGDTVIACFSQRDSVDSRRIWDHPYALSLTIDLGGPRISLKLTVTNPGQTDFSFTGGLHTYLRVDDLASASLAGLGGRPFIDTVGGVDRPAAQRQSLLYFPAETDRIYPDVPSPLIFRDSASQVEIASRGFADCVVWNPGPGRGASIPDLEPDGYLRFVCVEAAQIVKPVRLQPGQTWAGVQSLQVLEA